MIGKKLRVLVRVLVNLLELVFSIAGIWGIVFFVVEKWGPVYLLLVGLPLVITECWVSWKYGHVSRKYGGAGPWTSWRAFFEIEEKNKEM